MKLATTLALPALAALVSAAPLVSRGLSCSPHATGVLSAAFDGEVDNTLHFGDPNDDASLFSGGRAEKFQFFTCSPPSDKYKTGGDGAVYGQVRSTIHSDYCITLSGVLPGNINRPAADEEFKINSVKLERCANSDSDDARRQWFKGTEKDGMLYLAQVGYKEDNDRDGLSRGDPHSPQQLLVHRGMDKMALKL